MKKLLIILSVLFCFSASAQVQIFMIQKNSSTAYAVLRTVRINLASNFGSSPSSPTWNSILINGSVSTNFTSYTSSALNTETNAATAWTLTVPTTFQGATESAPTPGTANTGLYPDLVVRSGFFYDGTSAEPSIQINGLDPTKYYQVWFLNNSDSWRSGVTYWYSGAIQTPNVSESNNYGSNGVSEFLSPSLVRLKNVQSDGSGVLLMKKHQVSGSGGHTNAIIIQETNIADLGFNWFIFLTLLSIMISAFIRKTKFILRS